MAYETIGTAQDFATPTLWENDKTDLTAEGEAIGACIEGEAHDASFTIGGQSNVDSSHFMHFTAATGESFQDYKDDGGFKLTYDNSRGAYCHISNGKLRMETSYLRITKLQFERFWSVGGTSMIERHSSANDCLIDSCIFYDNSDQNDGMVVAGGTSNRYSNLLVIKKGPNNGGFGHSYGGRGWHITSVCISGSPASDQYGFGEGSGGTNQIHKSYAGGWYTGECFAGGSWNAISYCASEDSTASGTGAVTSVPMSTTTFLAVSATVEDCDFRIKDTGALHQAGGSRDGTTTKDILGNDRPASNVAIGCVEYVAAGGGEVSGTASLSGGGSLSASGTKEASGDAGLSGAGSLAASGSSERSGNASISDTGSLTVAGSKEASDGVSLSTGGTLAANGTKEALGSAAITDGGSLAATGSKAASAAATLSGAGALQASARTARFGDADLSGGGALTASGSSERSGSAAIGGDGSLAASGSTERSGSASISGGGEMAATATTARSGTASISGAGSISATGSAIGSGGVARISGAGSISASGSKEASGAAAIEGAGSLAAIGSTEKTGTAAAISGAGSLSASGAKEASGSAGLSQGGSLACTGAKTASGACAISGISALTVLGSKEAAGVAILSGGGTITASGYAGNATAIRGTASLTGTSAPTNDLTGQDAHTASLTGKP